VQEMVIYGVSFDMVGKQPIVLLKTVESNKFLPIWIGHPEAAVDRARGLRRDRLRGGGAAAARFIRAASPRPPWPDWVSSPISEFPPQNSQSFRMVDGREYPRKLPQ